MEQAEQQPRDDAVVIIVNWNGRDILRPCLDSLLSQRGNLKVGIVVVDNGSSDESLDMLSQDYPGVHVLALPENLGFAGGANAGIAATDSDAIVLMNNDAAAEPGFVAALVGALRDSPPTGAVTGRILLADTFSPVSDGVGSGGVASERASGLRGTDGTVWCPDPSGQKLINSTGNEVTRSGNGRDRDWLLPVSRETRGADITPGFSGGAVALRRTDIEQVGAFDDRLFMYYEDSDLSWRLQRAGWDIRYEPAATVHHQHAASSDSSSDFFLFHNERNRILFALKNAPLAVVARALGRTIGGAIGALLKRNPRTAGRKLRSITSALRMAPAMIAARRAIDRTATVPRSEVARTLVDD